MLDGKVSWLPGYEVDMLEVYGLYDLTRSSAWSFRNWERTGTKGLLGCYDRFSFLKEHKALLEHRLSEYARRELNYDIYDEDDFDRLFEIGEDVFSFEELLEVYNSLHREGT